MTLQLSSQHARNLATILGRSPEWQSVQSRKDFVRGALSGSPRERDILSRLDLDGTPLTTALRVIDYLVRFGQDVPGREVLGLLVHELASGQGDSDDSRALIELMTAYGLGSTYEVGQPRLNWHGTENDAQVAEKIIGENTLKDICELEALLEASRAVVRIRTKTSVGTGFMISEDLLITNHHVIPTSGDARDSAFEFNYELDRTGRARSVQTVWARNGGLFVTSPMATYNASSDQLDYTIIELDPTPAVVPLRLRRDPVHVDARVTIIQHPGGGYKKISVQNNFVEYSDSLVVQYTTSTEPGSSGSPVLAEDHQVAAIHHAGGVLSEPASKRRYLRNEGISFVAIVTDLQARSPEVCARLPH